MQPINTTIRQISQIGTSNINTFETGLKLILLPVDDTAEFHPTADGPPEVKN